MLVDRAKGQKAVLKLRREAQLLSTPPPLSSSRNTTKIGKWRFSRNCCGNKKEPSESGNGGLNKRKEEEGGVKPMREREFREENGEE